MAEGLNRVMLLGNLGADPELRYTQGGQAVLHMRLATTESFLDKDKVRRERTDWHNIVVWGKRGEALNNILAKGSTVFVEGSLRTSSYDDREGQKRYKTEVIANNLILAGGGGRGQRESGDGEQARGHGGQERGQAGGGYGGRRQERPRDAGANPYHLPGGARAPAAPDPGNAADSGYAGSEGGDYGGPGMDDIPF